ncbi:MAG: NAD(P)/FAD-dependent oxidoreductase [Acidimicrobiia bacterium]|jgi:cation diffusion facilitator CzcD-associated flavoprotein CzcO
MPRNPENASHFDPDAVHAKYQEERARRVGANRRSVTDLGADPRFESYVRDPWTEYTERAPVVDEVEVAIIGAGIAGIILGAKLREAGVQNVRLIDTAGGVGGTWYWNRYPGLFCDVEAYIYMPMLEEMAYVPSSRYATGDEIRRHIVSIAEKYDLVDGALFHTRVNTSEWDEAAAQWVIHTDRGDEVRARYLAVAPGILNLVKLPDLPGMEDFQGASFHTSRWDYGFTGGAPDDPHLTNLADKVVGIIGTGGTAAQCVPPLAESSKHLYVFQRTPSAIGVRDNRPTPPDFAADLKPGWQKERMENFSAMMIGRSVERDLIDDSWTHHMAKVVNPPVTADMSPEEVLRIVEEIDFAVMEEHRTRVAETVTDPAVAEVLKPYYRYMCKRPLFHDEFLPTFNRPDVTLVDCPRGVEQVTEHGVVVDGTEYELDCIVYATGFEAEVTPFPRRAGQTIIGRNGLTLAEKFKDGVASLHGIATRGFPNMFIMPAPATQSVTTVNYTHLAVLGAEHIAATVAMLRARGVRTFDVTQDAEDDWIATIVSGWRDNRDFMAACTPSRLNWEGDPSQANPRNGAYGGGYGDFFGYQDLLAEWRARGDFAGWEIDQP